MMQDCRSCRHEGNDEHDPCRNCWKDGVWSHWESRAGSIEETTATVSDDVTRLAEWLETATKIAMDKIQAEINAIIKEKRHYNSRVHDTTIYTYVAEELLEAGVTLPPEEGENDNA